MSIPAPVPGMVIRYSYLWKQDHQRGGEEGRKDRPCAVLLAVADDQGFFTVVVLPVTDTPPRNEDVAVEIPGATKKRLGLDDQRSWIVLSEANRFVWPGPDLRPTGRTGGEAAYLYGELPRALYDQVRTKWLALYKARSAKIIRRTD